MTRLLKLLSISFLLIPVFVFGYQNPGPPAGYVNDFAGMLTSDQRQSLETKISNFEQETSNELSVVTIPSLNGDSIENFAVKLFEDWDMGKKGKDNGVLLLIARDDRQMRIEVGYGLEGALTDADSFWIIQKALRPAFQGGDYYGGINAGVNAIISIIKGEFRSDRNQSAENITSAAGSYIFFFLWLAWIFFVWTGSVLARSKSWWGGGVVGGVVALIIGISITWLSAFISALILIPLGLWFDRFVSGRYSFYKETGQPLPWWIGGRSRGFRGGSGSGGFGGFGGGRSGGGGSSGGW